MLKNIEGNKIKITGAMKKSLELCKRKMKPQDLEAIKAELNLVLESAYNNQDSENRIVTSSWIPGADWRGTPYQAIYEDGAESNFELAAGYFGLLLLETVIERAVKEQEDWIFLKADGEHIKGSHYFRSTKAK